jgi:hypothetical protein
MVSPEAMPDTIGAKTGNKKIIMSPYLHKTMRLYHRFILIHYTRIFYCDVLAFWAVHRNKKKALFHTKTILASCAYIANILTKMRCNKISLNASHRNPPSVFNQ